MRMIIACFNVIFVASLFVCIYIYGKRHTLKNVWSLLTNIVTFIETFLLTKLFSSLIGSSISGPLENVVNKSLKVEEEWATSNSINDFISFTSTIVINVLMFLLIFLILYLIDQLLKKFIFKKVHKVKYSHYVPKNKDNKVVSVLCGVVTFVVVSFALLYPFGALVNSGNVSADKVEYKFNKDERALFNNRILKLYSYMGSKQFFNNVTYFKATNEEVKNSDEVEGLLVINYALTNISNEEDVTKNVNEIKESLTDTYLIPTLISELCSNAATRFKNNEPFLGMTLKIPNDASKEFYIDLLEIVSKWDKESLIENINTIFDLYDILYNNNILQAEKTDDLINAISKDEFNEDLFLCLFTNKDLKILLPKFMNYGISSLFDSLNIKTTNKEFIDIEDFNNLTEDDIKNEARIFSLIVRQFIEIDSYNGKEIPKDKFTEILNNLAEIRDSKILSNVIYNTLFEFLQS